MIWYSLFRIPPFYQICIIPWLIFERKSKGKGEERRGGMTFPRINDGTRLYKPLLLRVRESAVYSLLSPTTQTLFHHRISSVHFVPLTWSDL